MTRSSPSRPDPAELLRDLAAAPRPTGSPSIARARERVARELREIGFDVREIRFGFSAFPGRYATPLFGVAAILLVAVAGHLGAGGTRYLPLLILLGGAVALGAGGVWLSRRGVLDLPLLRQEGVMLEAKRPHARPPGLWLCAHLDTKSQPVPTLVRVAGIVVLAMGFGLTAAIGAAADLGMAVPRVGWIAPVLLTLTGSIPVVLSVVGDRSPGAFDNASGVAAIIDAARRLPQAEIGVLITDAEELGLAGARHWCRREPKAAGRELIILNCDGVDDGGRNVVMYSGLPPRELLQGVARASQASGIPAQARRMLPGILTDSVAFADAGHRAVTFSRGTLASLGRVHGWRDDLAHLRGAGIAEVGSLIAAAANELGWRTN